MIQSSVDLSETTVPAIRTTIRSAGIAGSGGAGFPSYAKWEHADAVDGLLVNHQESEPNFFIDKWLGTARADELGTLLERLHEELFSVIVIGAKVTDREPHLRALEERLKPTVYLPDELPIDDDASGFVIAYTEDRYEYGMESVLLRLVADTVIGNDLPMEHGWIVHNTETLFNIYRALTAGTPVTEKYLHIDGDVPTHRFVRAPIGTPGTQLLTAAGVDPAELDPQAVLADGGPGWCFATNTPPDRYGIRKRTNCVLVLDEGTIEEHTLGDDRINVLETYDRDTETFETEPTAVIEPDVVRIPLQSNPAFEGVVAPSEPIVEPGTVVERGEIIARPAESGISNPQHASIDGTVRSVTDSWIEIESRDRPSIVTAQPMPVFGTGFGYWSWCRNCGTYIVPPLYDPTLDLTNIYCRDCW